MNKTQQELYASFFEELYETEQILQNIKTNLNKHANYDARLLFEAISNDKNIITIEDMRLYLYDRVACNQRELYEIFQKFDHSRKGHITFTDFNRELSPINSNTHLSKHQKQLNSQIQAQLTSLFVQMLTRLRIVDVSRKQISFIAPYDAFSHIDYMKIGILGLAALKKFFQDNDLIISQYQLHLILHSLRRRCYLNVNLQVFCENLNPLEFGEYQAYAKAIEVEQEKQLLNRSRRQEDTIRRSRIQTQKIDHEAQKVERRRQAEIERKMQLEERFNQELLQEEGQKQRQFRRALLQDDRNIRWSMAHNTAHDDFRKIEDQYQNERLSRVKNQMRAINENLAQSALKKSQFAQMQNQKLRDLQLRQQIQRDLEFRRSREHFVPSEQVVELNVLRQRDAIFRQIQLEKIQNGGGRLIGGGNNNDIRNIRTAELQKELERTRLEMKERRSRLQLQDQIRRQKMAQGFPRSYRI